MIQAPLIWIVLPGMIAVMLYTLRRWERLTLAIGILTSLLLAWMAWQWPIGEAIPLGLWPGMPSLRIEAQLIILGRSLTLANSTRPMLILIYLGIGFWLGGAYTARVNRLFTPLGLAVAALLVAALAIRPTLYAALLVETVALVCLPILSPPGEPAKQGVIRFLAFQTIGMCFILLGDWWIPPIEVSAMDATRALQAVALIGLGFALLEAVFPFHTWVPMLTEQAHPFAVTFVLFILPVTVGLVGLNYLDLFDPLSIAPAVYAGLRMGGVFLVAIGGVWAALQNHLGRILGFAVITQIGLGLLIFSLRVNLDYNPLYLGLYFALLLPEGLCLGLWGLSLQIIKSQAGDLRFRSVQGIGRRLPVTATSLVVSNLSLAGLPLLASFPVMVILWSILSAQSLSAALVVLAGSACLLIAGIRSMAVLSMSPKGEGWHISEKRTQILLLALGCLGLFLLGLLPQVFLPSLINMAFIYANPGP
jgi:NADH:ubiquinone oxidoreductase subunit 2 (subunit N)